MPVGSSVKAVACLWQVMKAVSGKFHPIFQWFYFDSVESLPENLPLPPEEVDLQVGLHSIKPVFPVCNLPG